MKVSWLPWKEFKNGRRGIADVIVNTTSVGMVPDVGRSVVPKRLVCGIVAVDAVYNPPVTRFLIDARRSGSRVVSGMDWFLNQAVRQAKVFGVRRPDPLLMLRTLRRHTSAT
jgi:shikimate 5-dehydrogenase